MFVCPQSQEKEARDEMKRRAKELQIARKEASKRGGRGGAYNVGGGFGSSDYNPGPSVGMSASHQPSKPAYNPPRYIHNNTQYCVLYVYIHNVQSSYDLVVDTCSAGNSRPGVSITVVK